MAITIEDLIDTQLSTIGLTVLDYRILHRLRPNWGGTNLQGNFDRAKIVLALLNAKVKFFHAWVGENPQPVLVAAWSARDLARRIEYLVDQPVLVKPVDTDEVGQSIAPKPEPVQPRPVIDRRPDWAKRAEAIAARDKVESELLHAKNGLEQIKAEPKQMSAIELKEHQAEIEDRIKQQERRITEAQAKLEAILERQAKAS